MKKKDKYSEPKTIELPGCTATVYSPILTEEERKRRMARIAESAAALLRSRELSNGGQSRTPVPTRK